MKKLLLIPTALFPYAVSLFLFCFFKSKTGASVTLPYLIISCVVCACLALACNVVFLLLSRKDSAERLCKTALILKAIHIPAYVAIFVLGLILGLMFFMTFPILLLLIFLDCVTLFFSGMISVFALIKNRKNGILKGAIVGLIFILLTFLIFSAMNGFKDVKFNWLDLAFLPLGGAIIGVIRVNLPERRK